MQRSVVITGMGVVTRTAQTVAQFQNILFDGGPPPHPPQQFDAARFRAQNAHASDPETTRNGRMQAIQEHSAFLAEPPTPADLDCAGHGIHATLQAVAQAQLSRHHLAQAGCALATTSGGLMDIHIDHMFDDTMSDAPATHLAPVSTADCLHRLFGMAGPLCSISSACVSSLGAISYAVSRIQRSDAPVMIVGGSDRMREADFAGFNALRAMDRDSCRPFDTTRKGMMIGDGAAILVLEDEAHALDRGAQPLARISGLGISTDAHHITTPHPQGVTRAMHQALAQAGRTPQEISYVNCHGTGTPLNDAAEAEALAAVFPSGEPRPVISSTKGTTGHLLGTAGALETIATVLALHAQTAPSMPTTQSPENIGFTMPVPGQNPRLSGGIGMKNSLGFGGLNASLILETCGAESAPEERVPLPCV